MAQFLSWGPFFLFTFRTLLVHYAFFSPLVQIYSLQEPDKHGILPLCSGSLFLFQQIVICSHSYSNCFMTNGICAPGMPVSISGSYFSKLPTGPYVSHT
ncbi:hypothetical protein F4677DRAFT_418609 [Hypoxylon crocopeplum]|nr:hypothetical protein F4677DRAFT_418609 [Hypoxylon crocopeplum]